MPTIAEKAVVFQALRFPAYLRTSLRRDVKRSCEAAQSGRGAASVTVGSSLLRGNAIAVQGAGGASLLSYGNNHVTGNASNGSFTGTVGLQSSMIPNSGNRFSDKIMRKEKTSVPNLNFAILQIHAAMSGFCGHGVDHGGTTIGGFGAQ